MKTNGNRWRWQAALARVYKITPVWGPSPLAPVTHMVSMGSARDNWVSIKDAI